MIDYPTLGEMSDVFITNNYTGAGGVTISGNGEAVEFTTGGVVTLYGGGGNDLDVCVGPSGGECSSFRSHVVDSVSKWKVDGVDHPAKPGNPEILEITPPRPGTYTVTFIAEEDEEDPSNVGDESKSTSTQIVVYEIRGIYPDPGSDTLVPRAQSQDYYVELEYCSPIPGYPKWSSDVTTATGTGLSWGGEHAVSYELSVDVKASVTLPLNTVLVSKKLSKDVVTTKGRTFECYVENLTKRYPVPSSFVGNRTGTDLVQTAAVARLVLLGITHFRQE